MNSIEAARRWAGFSSNRSAAAVAGIPRASLLRYEAGKQEPGSQALRKMALAWGLTTDQILGLQPLPPPKVALPFAPPPGHPEYERYLAQQKAM